MNMLMTRSLSLSAMLLTAGLAACGGGGGDGSGTDGQTAASMSGETYAAAGADAANYNTTEGNGASGGAGSYGPGTAVETPSESSSTPTPVPAPAPTTGPLGSVSYTSSTAQIFNPERGLYRYVDCNSSVGASTLQSYRNEGTSLVYCIVNLSSFINSPISQTQLDLFQRRMDEFRSAGLKAIPR
ncbi:DUF4874 domain-containing protein, partial [Herbaspirillum sp. GCM10030257]|uniref:DUF4874 domain-containing protein n=1 Tax=Herbaspirillum sp. GCM10030257 TaxID=3273393 RepID=UPI0036073447